MTAKLRSCDLPTRSHFCQRKMVNGPVKQGEGLARLCRTCQSSVLSSNLHARVVEKNDALIKQAISIE